MRVCLTAILTFISLAVFGQVHLGLKAGVSLSKVKTTNFASADNLEYNTIASVSFGVSSQIEFKQKLHLNADFLFTGRGYDIYGYKTKVTYLELPLLLAYPVIKNLDVEFGSDFGCKIIVNSEQPGISAGTINTFDFGIATGVKFRITETLFISGRYIHGVTSIATLYKTTESDSKTFNRSFQFSLGYMFGAKSYD